MKTHACIVDLQHHSAVFYLRRQPTPAPFQSRVSYNRWPGEGHVQASLNMSKDEGSSALRNLCLSLILLSQQKEGF